MRDAVINFDNAATTYPKPASVRRAAFLASSQLGGNAGRGGHVLAMRSSQAVYSARETIAGFFGAEPVNVVFTLNCTHALNLAIHGVMHGGGHIIISSMEHNSAARPAVSLALEKRISLSAADVTADSSETAENFRSLMRHDTKAVVCTIASNVTGQILPYKEIAGLCRERGICFIADGAQACGILDIKMSDGINILCTAGHKGLYGTAGTGLLISDGKYKLYPHIQGGTGSASSDLRQPLLLPEALESGTLNIPGIMALKAGAEFVASKGTDNIFRHEERICRRFISELSGREDIKIYRTPGAEYVPIVSFTAGDMLPERTAAVLSGYGYCLRAGFHCAALAHRTLGTKNGTVRFSPSVFSREEDAVRLAELLRNVTV